MGGCSVISIVMFLKFMKVLEMEIQVLNLEN